MKNIEGLNSTDFDILKEVGNIGAGNAVTTLSAMLGRKIDMKVPVINLLEFKDIAEFIGGAEQTVIGILVKITGDIDGIMMFVFRMESAAQILRMLMGCNILNVEEMGEMELSALKEIGNILASSYLNSLSMLTNKSILPSIPYLSIDMANAILSVPAIEFGKMADRVLFIESLFMADDNSDVSGYFILCPDYASFQKILSSLGVS